ncbi:alpha/beta hydrolase [Rhodobacter ferrooxidans]|uniref:Peptidase S15 n=1 Tax=Rhodobacter ferrooxidans TaxID=371731 RepID=C8RZ02_9RHOB|nr:alpha/beta hydrolase [Rhodobacter sp. SW2]EEW25959.1 peptidase S15 [Rhodobacter sp. SW2]
MRGMARTGMIGAGMVGALLLAAGAAAAGETALVLEGGIAATLNLPDGVPAAPAVLMLHGFGSSRDEVGGMYAREAAALAAKGVASLRIDFHGFGQSDGDTGATTVPGQLADAEAALAALAATPGVDGQRIGVLGFSLGGGVAMLLASGHPDAVKALATWSSVGDFHADFLEELGQPAFDRAAADGIVGLDLGWRTIALKASFFDTLQHHDLMAALVSYPGPYLSVTGEKDFAATYAPGFLAAAANPMKEAVIVPGGDHIYGVLSEDQSMAEGVIAKTAVWLAGAL